MLSSHKLKVLALTQKMLNTNFVKKIKWTNICS